MLNKSTLKQSLLLGASIMCFAFSCNKEDVKVGVPVSIPITLDMKANGTAIDWKKEYDADEESPEFKKYKNNIGNIEVSSIKYTVISTSGADNQMLSATLNVSGIGADSTNKKLIGSISGYSPKANIGVEKDFSASAETKAYLVSLLKKEPPKYKVYVNGTSNTAVTNFKLKVTFNVKVTPKV